MDTPTPERVTPAVGTKTGTRGVWIACTIIFAWLANQALWLNVPLTDATPGWLWALTPLGLALQVFLSTGLFITAHDSMHGSLAPGRPKLNRAIGIVAVLLYALFDYRRLLAAHKEHHRTPAAPGDPDWHDGQHTGFFRWYIAFLRRYVTVAQIIGMAVAFNLLQYGLGFSTPRLLVFWVAPPVLSTFQLFYFGTFKPHRLPVGGHTNRHNATTSGYPVWLSFLTCYHFGYHDTHHAQPGVPWWRLPEARSQRSG